MVGGVKKQCWMLAVLTIAGLAGCKDKEEPFLPLPELCPRLAEDICAARALCCEPAPDASACVQAERAQCEPAQNAFAGEEGLYDSPLAARWLSTQRDALDACDPPLPLGRFFKGARSDGADCERDTQCRSGRCDVETQTCASFEAVALCPAP
jgi:hypothetical protein